MGNADKIQLIETYYRGTLKGNDKNHFNQMMKEDPSFKQEVKDYKQIFQGLESLHIEQFHGNILQFETKYKDNVVALNNTTSNVRPIKKVYLAAATIALLICAMLGYNELMPSEFDQNFHASQSIAVHIGAVRAGENPLSEPEQIKKTAYNAYQQKNYEKAIALIKDYMKTFPDEAEKDCQSLLVLGVAQLATGQAEDASKNLALVMNNKGSNYQEEAEWMWVMAQYKLDKKSSTKTVLESIAKESGNIHQEAAIKLLKGL